MDKYLRLLSAGRGHMLSNELIMKRPILPVIILVLSFVVVLTSCRKCNYIEQSLLKNEMRTFFRICVILVFCSSLMASRCKKDSEECHKSIKASNNSNKAVYFMGDESFDPEDYPGPSPIHYTDKVNPGDQNIRVISYRGECYETLYAYDPTPFNIYVFDAEVIENMPWIEVRKQQLYIKKYENITLDTLRKWNWTVVFP